MDKIINKNNLSKDQLEWFKTILENHMDRSMWDDVEDPEAALDFVSEMFNELY